MLRKRFIAVMIILSMVIAFLPAGKAQAETEVIWVSTLEELQEAVQGSNRIINLENDIEANKNNCVVRITGDNLQLDLYGHTIRNTKTDVTYSYTGDVIWVEGEM